MTSALTPSHRAGAGEPLVLLHGFTDTWRGWVPLLERLQASHEVFAPTLPGHHGGEPFPDHMPFSLEGLVDLLERRLDAEGIERAHFAGSSLGGWLALELAARGRALSVVGVCPAGGWEPGIPLERAITRYFRRSNLLLRAAGPRRLRIVATRPRLRALALREVVARPQNVSAADAVGMFEGAAGCAIVAEALALARSGEAFGELEPIDCPVRILYGTRDVLLPWPLAFTRMQRLLPEAEYVALEDLGHLPMWDDPELVARLIVEVSAPVAPSAGDQA